MTIEKFIETELRKDIYATNITNISNKKWAKVVKSYKYIDVNEYWYDDPDDPEDLVWIDIEGMGYGWLWLSYKSEKKLRKVLQRWALDFHRNEPIYTFTYDDVKYYLFALDKEIIVVRLSRKELDPIL